MAKNILTIGLQLASDAARNEEFQSKISLLDWDIILFRPEISGFFSTYRDHYQGKLSLNDLSSFQLKECCEHWRREIKQALDAGKTVVVFLSPIQEVYIDTGEREYSGTGRNQKTTRLVALYNNYKSLPMPLSLVNSTGSAMKLAHLGAEILAPYWAEFGPVSEYKVLLAQDTKSVCITTKNGDRPVGAIMRSQTSSGALILLPDIDFFPEDFIHHEEDEGDEEGGIWTPKATQFASRMMSAVIALDKALHSAGEVTPEPAWATGSAYVLATERSLRSELLDAERKVEEAQREKEDLLEKLKVAGSLRGLLYEKGKPLENAIIDALKVIGFQAAPYKEADSEFDVVFESPEGRLLGEAEGKDAKAINVDKLRQLAMNIHEDLRREEVSEPAKGVLFGNGYRLVPPAERNVQFTEKCITAAQLSSTALLPTSELFVAAQYISECSDESYAKICREALLKGVGLVSMPVPPEENEEKISDVSE